MRAEKYLNQIKRTVEKIHGKQEELKALKWKASGVGAIRYDKEKVQTSPQNYMEMAIADALEIEAELEEDEASIEEIKGNAYAIVRRMKEPMQRALIEWFYLNGFPMVEVANKMNMSERNAYYLKDDSLESFGMLME